MLGKTKRPPNTRYVYLLKRGGGRKIGRETRLYSSLTDYKFSSEEIQNFGKKSKNRAERNDVR
jgi:hypothetical protein